MKRPKQPSKWSYRGAEVEQYAEGSTTSEIYKNKAFVAVMGMTGAGKSSLISLLSNQDVKIGHGLESSTSGTQCFSFTHGPEPGELIDTPGFDDTSRSDTDILKEIANFFCNMYVKGYRLNGIIYLHRISDPRMSGSAIKNLNIFQRLCGMHNLPNVILVTTMWNELQQHKGGIAVGEAREKELKTNDDFWASMINRGSSVMRHTGDLQSAQRILSSILAFQNKIDLQIATEMVEERLFLDQTTAGKFLKQEYADLVHRYGVEIEGLKESKSAAMNEGDSDMAMMMDEELSKLNDEIRETKVADNNLNLSFPVLQDEKSRSFGEQFAYKPATTTQVIAASSQSCDYDPRDVEEIVRVMEEQHLAELEAQEEEHRSLIAREKRRLGAKAKSASANNEYLTTLVYQLSEDKKELVRRNTESRIRTRGGRRRYTPPGTGQLDGNDQAIAAAKAAWGFALHVVTKL